MIPRCFTVLRYDVIKDGGKFACRQLMRPIRDSPQKPGLGKDGSKRLKARRPTNNKGRHMMRVNLNR